MAEFFNGESESLEANGADFVAESAAVYDAALHDAALLPKLSARLRARIVDAALKAYRRARRLGQARQAASFVVTCVLAAFVVSPIVLIKWPTAEDLKVSAQHWPASLASVMQDSEPIELPQSSIWVLRHSAGRDVDRRGQVPLTAVAVVADASPVKRIALAQRPEPTNDPLLAGVRSSNDWLAVESLQAIRVRNLQSLSRVVVTN